MNINKSMSWKQQVQAVRRWATANNNMHVVRACAHLQGLYKMTEVEGTKAFNLVSKLISENT